MPAVLSTSSGILYTRNKSLFWNKAHRYRCNSCDLPVHYILSSPSPLQNYYLLLFLVAAKPKLCLSVGDGRSLCRPFGVPSLTFGRPRSVAPTPALDSLRKQGYYKQVRSHAHFVRFSSSFIDYKLQTTNYELIIPPFREDSRTFFSDK